MDILHLFVSLKTGMQGAFTSRKVISRTSLYTLRGHNLRFWTSLAGCDARRPECGLVILKQATGNTAAHPPDAEQKCKL
jgi:hypothetical protein